MLHAVIAIVLCLVVLGGLSIVIFKKSKVVPSAPITTETVASIDAQVDKAISDAK